MSSVLAEIVISGLGVLMIYSGARKAVQRQMFEEALGAYDPVVSSKLLARCWAGAEVAAGVACLVPHPGRVVGLTWVLAAATGAVARRVVQRETHDCGCHRRPRMIGTRALIGNTLSLSALCGLSIAFAGVDGLLPTLAGIPVAATIAFFVVGSRSNKTTADATKGATAAA